MSQVRANSITNSAGTGAPDFPNGLTNNGVSVATTANVAAVNTALQFISSATINNVATVDFTGFDSSKYSDYVFSLDNVIPVTDNTQLCMRFSTNGGSSYETSYRFVSIRTVTGTTTVSTNNSASSTVIQLATDVGSDTNEFGVSGEVKLFGPDLTARTYATFSCHVIDTIGAAFFSTGSGENVTTSAVNAVRFLFGVGNLESGRITMYGVRKS